MQRNGSSLSDEALNKLLKKLEPLKPVIVGLDIFRDRSVSPLHSDLKPGLQQIISICSAEDREKNSPAVSPPPEIGVKQMGFTNTARDPDGTIRRHTIGMDSSKVCKTDKSFSYQLSSRYLARVRAVGTRPPKGTLYIGSRAFPNITNNTSGYNQPVLGGYEVMLNYRASSQIAEKVRLSEILNGSKDNQLENLIRDRIILIGTTARSYNDYRFTPYGGLPTLLNVQKLATVRQMPS
jgi:CHASE2 domain-containing sensor protein